MATLSAEPTRRSGGRLRRLLVLAGIALLVALAFSTGLVERLSDQERLKATVEDAGVLGPMVFLGLMVLLVPLNVPGLVFVVPSTALFGTAGGVLLSLAGGFVASAVGIVGARRLGRPALESRMSPRIRALEARLSRHGFWGVVLVRSFTFLLQPVDWLCGLSSMRMRTVLSATFVGLVPPTLVVALGGGSLLGSL